MLHSKCSEAHIYISYSPAASNPDMADLLPHMRGQGVMDLEFESDGKLKVIIWVWYRMEVHVALTQPPSPH